jgi:hypothetical protein
MLRNAKLRHWKWNLGLESLFPKALTTLKIVCIVFLICFDLNSKIFRQFSIYCISLNYELATISILTFFVPNYLRNAFPKWGRKTSWITLYMYISYIFTILIVIP